MQAALEMSASPLRVDRDRGGQPGSQEEIQLQDRDAARSIVACYRGGFRSCSWTPQTPQTPQMVRAEELQLGVFAVCQDRLARKRVPSEAKPEIKRAWLIVLAAAAVHPGAEQPRTRLA